MSVWIQHIETMNPGIVYTQEYAGKKMQEWTEDDRLKRLIGVLYKKSGIKRRYSVISSFDQDLPGDFFPPGPDGRRRQLSTAERNAIYARESKQLAVSLARQTIANCPALSASDITHVVTVSCTGFSNPGIDYHIVNDLGLSHATQRYHVGFMGCYAAFPGLRMAREFCEANPEAVVLVMCLELCSLHLQLNDREDSMLANSLFSDGAAAVIVSAKDPQPGQSAYRFRTFHSALIPDGQAEMAWTIGDLGFDIALSSYVPKIIGANIGAAVQPLLAANRLGLGDVTGWAVHPGGKSIIDRVVESLGLAEGQVAASRKVLSEYGNMSSATVLYVLREMLARAAAPVRENVCAMAFGPGLTVEMSMLEAHRQEKHIAMTVAETADMHV